MLTSLAEVAVVVAQASFVDDGSFGVLTRMTAFVSGWARRFAAFFRLHRITKAQEPINRDSDRVGSDSAGDTTQRRVKTAKTAKQMIRLSK